MAIKILFEFGHMSIGRIRCSMSEGFRRSDVTRDVFSSLRDAALKVWQCRLGLYHICPMHYASQCTSFFSTPPCLPFPLLTEIPWTETPNPKLSDLGIHEIPHNQIFFVYPHPQMYHYTSQHYLHLLPY